MSDFFAPFPFLPLYICNKIENISFIHKSASLYTKMSIATVTTFAYKRTAYVNSLNKFLFRNKCIDNICNHIIMSQQSMPPVRMSPIGSSAYASLAYNEMHMKSKLQAMGGESEPALLCRPVADGCGVEEAVAFVRSI